MRTDHRSESAPKTVFKTLSSHLTRRLVWYLVASYGVAAAYPDLGLWLRAYTLGTIRLGGATQQISAPTLLLGVMLFNASIATNVRQLGLTFTHPRLLIASLVANIVIPVAFVTLLGALLSPWPDLGQARGMVTGLAILASMPIAASSTTWVQQARGDIALSLGMVLVSTTLSPLATPLIFWLMAHCLPASLTLNVHGLGGSDTQLFLLTAVVFPCTCGLLVHQLLPTARLQRLLQPLKLISKLCLLFLNYCNGAVALPHLLRTPAWGYLILVLAVAAALCAVRFVGGYWLGKQMRAAPQGVTTTMFGLGMNNNGSGLTLAAQELPQHGSVLVTIVAYNLAQQIAAGMAHQWRSGRQQPNVAA